MAVHGVSEFTPFQSPALQRELPGLREAMDPALVMECFRTSLFENCSGRFQLDDCELRQITYVPRDCCLLRYRLGITDRESGGTVSALVSGRVFPDASGCEHYACGRLTPLRELAAGRREVLPFTEPVAVIPALHMAVAAFPIDGELPTLIPATDPRRMAGILGGVAPIAQRHKVPVESCRIELVDYGRQHRATLKFVLCGETDAAGPELARTVYGKLTADGSGARAGQVTAALRDRVEQSGFHFHVPESFGWVPDLQLSLLSAIPGRPLLEHAVKARLRSKPEPAGGVPLDRMVEACAGIAAAVHSSGLEAGPRRTLDSELAWLSAWMTEVGRLSPGLAARLRPWIDRVSALRAGPEPDCGPCHGDFTTGQVLFEDPASGLVDFDSVCQGEPSLDLGQFLAYLRLAALHPRSGGSGHLAESLGKRFLDAYIARAPGRTAAGQLATRAAAYQIISLLRRAIRSWQKFRPDRVEVALAALGELD